jgi:hypothetical protein
VIERWNQYARRHYLWLLACPEDYAYQEPECGAARWYHLLWYVFLLFGDHLFMEAVRRSYREGK